MAVYTGSLLTTSLPRSSRSTTSARRSPGKGIAEGVENTNYLLLTEGGPYILTLYEKRVGRQGPGRSSSG